MESLHGGSLGSLGPSLGPPPSDCPSFALKVPPGGIAYDADLEQKEEDEMDLASSMSASFHVYMNEESARRLSDIRNISEMIEQEQENLQADQARRNRLQLDPNEGLLSSFNVERTRAKIIQQMVKDMPPAPPTPKAATPTPAPPPLTEVPAYKGWMQKKGRSRVSLWRWRYFHLTNNMLAWWKTKEDFDNNEGDISTCHGYLDFNAVPPHISMELNRFYTSVAVEMPGRNYRLYSAVEADFDAVVTSLKSQEANTRERLLRDQDKAMDANLSEVQAIFNGAVKDQDIALETNLTAIQDSFSPSSHHQAS